jgi:hypothetical protein
MRCSYLDNVLTNNVLRTIKIELKTKNLHFRANWLHTIAKILIFSPNAWHNLRPLHPISKNAFAISLQNPYSFE